MAAPAFAQDAKPAALTAIDDRSPPRAALPDEVADVPSDAPLVIYAPALGRAIEATEATLDALSPIDPAFSRPVGVLIAEAVWGTSFRLPSIAGMRPVDPRQVLKPAGLRDAGIDAAAPLVLIPTARGVTMIRFGLSDRRAFEAWLDRIGGRDRPRMSIGAETASVLLLDSEHPITCIVRHTQAICQLGANEGSNAIADLMRLVAGGAPTYRRLTGVVSAQQRLPRNAVLYVYANPIALARDTAFLYAARERRRTRFADSRSRAISEEEIRQMTARLSKWSRWVDGGAAAVLTHERIGVHVELTPSATGKRLIAEALPDRSTDDIIGRWVETPALFSALVHADPVFVQNVAQSFGLDLPKDALTGTLGLLGLGIDSECPSAKQDAVAQLDWAFLIPSALNVGLAATSADDVHRLLSARFPVASGTTPWIKQARPPMAGLAAGSPYEIHVLDRMMIVGTGVGAGAAALRRLASIEASRKKPVRAPFLRAAIHPRAIDASFASGAFGREHRRELLAFESLRLQLKPLMERIDTIELEAKTSTDHERVSLEVLVK